MMDIIDRAMELEELQRSAALAQHDFENQWAGFSAYECVDCGEPIPQARRAAVDGCQCCLSCQEERERYAKTGVVA